MSQFTFGIIIGALLVIVIVGVICVAYRREQQVRESASPHSAKKTLTEVSEDHEQNRQDRLF